ncbi:MAG: hypothetical protein COA79_01215 [Planctomycetota bacterium]|nr:MAG: hypothetical protein COA79_01215 [Planctomycetota bacterium]
MSKNNLKILIVDDNEDNLLILKSDLEQMGFLVDTAASGLKAIALAETHKYSLVILDVDMPEMDGYETFNEILKVPRYQDVPVLFLSAIRIKWQDVAKGLRTGAFDYIVKPYNYEELNCRIELLLSLYKKNRELSSKNELLTELAIKDSLTNIYNRRFGMEALQKENDRHSRFGGNLSIIMVDLDDFKSINDKYGHNIGDKALIFIAKILQDSIRDTDTCFRSGGDEFLIILPNADEDACEMICKRIFERNRIIKGYQEVDIEILLSLGVAVFDTPQNDINYLRETADLALINAKSAGKNRYKIINERYATENAKNTVLNIASVRSSVKLILSNVLYEVLSEFDIDEDVVNGHAELMIELIEKLSVELNLPTYDENRLLTSVKLRRFEHLGVSKELLKMPPPITEDQKNVLSQALIENIEKLSNTSFFEDEAVILLNHHEYCDGSGYPLGKTKDDIPYVARLMAVIEAFAVLALGGPRTRSFGFSKALEILEEDSDSHFDGEIVQSLKKVVQNSYEHENPHNQKILLIDDQVAMTKLIYNYLLKFNFKHVDVSNTRTEALTNIEKNKYDLIITDISLPGTNKLSFLDDLKKINKSVTPLIVISSGYAALAWKEKDKYNITKAFRKPVNLHSLCQTVKLSFNNLNSKG